MFQNSMFDLAQAEALGWIHSASHKVHGWSKSGTGVNENDSRCSGNLIEMLITTAPTHTFYAFQNIAVVFPLSITPLSLLSLEVYIHMRTFISIQARLPVVN